MREYGEVLRLLEDGRASHAGQYYDVEAALWLAERTPVPIVVGTLGEEMCRAAGRFADGIMTWLAPASYLASVVLPAAREGPSRQEGPYRGSSPPCQRLSRATAGRCWRGSTPPSADGPGTVLSRHAGAGRARPARRRRRLDGGDARRGRRLGRRAHLRGPSPKAVEAGAHEVVLWPFAVADSPVASLAATLEAIQELAAR
jgi:alkanesulfonate monooxygenase SsuD/methylene tetrahydromethanopterin reductase-like flavin-dependent oxidoreductase (luciferase family)